MVPGKQPGKQHTIPELRPPGTLPDPAANATHVHRGIWLALAALAGLGLAVVLVLPKLVTEPAPGKPETVANPAPEMVTEPAPGEPETVANPVPRPDPVVDMTAARAAAEQTLQSYLQLRAKLELANAAAWGEPEWGRAAQAATAGDRLFGQRQFAMAADSYAAAVQGLQALESGRDRRLQTALESGQLALDRDDSAVAVEHFEMALAIEPGHETAMLGLQRAQARTELLQFMAAGEQAESVNDLQAAQEAYQSATGLDGLYEPAATALQRVTVELTEIAFQDAMGRALMALDAGRLGDAGTALQEAADLKPADPVVQETRQRLAEARRQARLAGLRRQAAAKTREESWSEAVTLYRKALAIDTHAGFARDGLVRAEDRNRLHQQLDRYLADPERLYSEKPLANAEQLLKSAGSAPAAEPQLADKLARLQQLVTGARMPQPVTLRSDGMTSVVIYHVGRLGEFTSQRLELKPGTYTAVGSRAGYRDVRRTFTVTPGHVPPPVDIRCEEPV
jgi:tetratricopeptide (TPR) repeat protein